MSRSVLHTLPEGPEKNRSKPNAVPSVFPWSKTRTRQIHNKQDKMFSVTPRSTSNVIKIEDDTEGNVHSTDIISKPSTSASTLRTYAGNYIILTLFIILYLKIINTRFTLNAF